uniref:Uncharacterized protein n=1 Tax=Nelumbo nucifera TaxID=4432 RepID=A0A822YN58_NELNU|nr:TPA_asm: hypothetical protein HUJ06_012823 [Nelumbo nucifera]
MRDNWQVENNVVSTSNALADNQEVVYAHSNPYPDRPGCSIQRRTSRKSWTT